MLVDQRVRPPVFLWFSHEKIASKTSRVPCPNLVRRVVKLLANHLSWAAPGENCPKLDSVYTHEEPQNIVVFPMFAVYSSQDLGTAGTNLSQIGS